MNQAAHILLVENDGRLLNERAELLGNFWTMAAVSAFDEAGEQLRAAEMLVLGQTMTEEQRLMWIAASRESAPARPVISVVLINSEHGPAARRTGVDAVVDYRQGPAALVSTIYELLNERGLKSKQWAGGGHTLLSPDGLPEIRK